MELEQQLLEQTAELKKTHKDKKVAALRSEDLKSSVATTKFS